mmetsp:Transcript_514/g.617  ORF Transcript_514/g.617 Transcript_514/m.617 type:complete len:102 (-) Transcript_514:277-582(-)|eukprot:CAMPEP_0194132058 /NCGR_PEP_ID=MMETSP0152-20130528/2616_1 /TAXON_ID=1049557 /ORGANISM="Thalassiothrix antarctica, Strain L6-D1" /LENGTH=101 /DNA_ID=CAMNT_0038826975 /DNA_START=50 /DNA_END=355 /DNA_ORIENTATION=+
MKRLSGLQKDVIHLYRTVLRVAIKKDRSSSSNNNGIAVIEENFLGHLLHDQTSTHYARHEFRKQAMQVKRSDFKTIEYQLRKGHKQLKVLQMPGVKTFRGS